MRSLLLVASLQRAFTLDDGVALSPPMGWRSWNQFGLDINQTLIEGIYEAIADRSRTVDGKPTSLLDLGYVHASIDDGWQLCNSGPNGHGFHNASGFPNVDPSRFPDMRAMASKAHSLGVKPGWYENNCHCSDHSWGMYSGLAAANTYFGMDGIKMDRAGLMNDATKLAATLNATGRHVLQENNDAKAHRDSDGNVVCPMHMFRTGLDIRPTYGSMLGGMGSVRRYNEGGLTGPGCWAHADMLTVGVTAPQPPGAKHHCESATNPCFMNVTEWRTHFAAWSIISNPLILSMDLRDTKQLDLVWPIVSNRHAINVNQQWFGDSGRLHNESAELVMIPNCGSGSSCKKNQWMVWSKALPPSDGEGSRVAILLMNNGPTRIEVSTNFDGVYGLGLCGAPGCSVREVWTQRKLPDATHTTVALDPHDSEFLIVSSMQAPPVASTTMAPTPSPVGPCIQPNILYDSKKQGNTLLDGKSRTVTDSTACQELCYETDGCVCFSHRKSLGHCWLMTECKLPEDNELYDSGTATCAFEV
jgi:alpha-galactosidase